MPESNIVLYTVAEAAILLLVISIFLIFHVSNLKKLIRKLEDKIVSLRKSVGKSRKETQAALKKLAEKEQIKPIGFLDYLDNEIETTRDYHQSLKPDRDIVLDISLDAPLDRQAASLRHAFLIAEKEARYAGDEDESSWDVLQSKFQQIIHFYEPAQSGEDDSKGGEAISAEQVEDYEARIEELERLKLMLEDRWEESKQEARGYNEQLLTMGEELGAGQDFVKVLGQYSGIFGEQVSVEEGGDAGMAVEAADIQESEEGDSVGKAVISNQKEIQRLRNMSIDQHKMIGELKKKLAASESSEEQQQVVEELSDQLDTLQRFLQEAETCTQLVEDELSSALQENETLRTQLDGGGHQEQAMGEEELQRLESVVSDLTSESKEMLSTIATLEQENQTLKQQVESGSPVDSDESVTLLKEKLGEMQQELLNLQTQHIELEERYMELKMK